jgi:GTP-binding protein EngB required for normal cell division
MFDENHQRILMSRIQGLDDLLSEAMANLSPTDDGRLFQAHVADATLNQRQILADYVAQLYFLLRRFLRAQGLSGTGEPVSALWAFRVAVSFARTAATELGPHYLRGYGSIDTEATEALERLVAELMALLRRMADYLDRGEGGGLTARLRQLDATRDEVALLLELERIITVHGLVELRASLEHLAERAAAARFEIAVFGRVNAGKSSLLNWWLEQPLLPTGVTPVTAVPTRIVRGKIAQARVTLASSPPTDIPVDELPAYVSEEGNAANHKHVMEIEIRVPAARLMDGVCLVDTPGLASLASAGTAQTLEYLPRCDLGVFLFEAGVVVSREELDVARAMVDSGSELVIALSKSDRLSGTDLAQALAYLDEQLRKQLHQSFTVQPISTLPTHMTLVETWFERELAPRLATHRERAAVALRRKIGVLREVVIALLQGRLMLAGKAAHRTGEHMSPNFDMSEHIPQTRAQIEHLRRELASFGLDMRRQRDQILDAATAALTHGWMTSPSDTVTLRGQVEAAIAASAAAACDGISDRLRGLRGQLQRALDEATGPGTGIELPLPRGRPLLDTAAISLQTIYVRPRGLYALRPLLRAKARGRLERSARASIERQLAVYGDALRHWGTKCLDDMVLQFDTALALGEGTERIMAATAMSAEAASALRHDLERLQQWPEQGHIRPPSAPIPPGMAPI